MSVYKNRIINKNKKGHRPAAEPALGSGSAVGTVLLAGSTRAATAPRRICSRQGEAPAPPSRAATLGIGATDAEELPPGPGASGQPGHKRLPPVRGATARHE
jgi:hypothetical protein